MLNWKTKFALQNETHIFLLVGTFTESDIFR